MSRTARSFLPAILAALVAATAAGAAGTTLDESTARATLQQNPRNVLAALVEVQSRCRAEDAVCLDGVRVVEVLYQQSTTGAAFKPGDWLTLNVGAGADEGLPAIGDRVLFVGPPFAEKDGNTGFAARAFRVAPSPKDVNELRSVIQSLAPKPGA